MPPAPWLAVCSKAASSSSIIWYRVCTKHGTSSGNLSSSRFGIRSGTRSVLFRMPADVRDLIAGLVPAERRPDLVHDLGQDLSGRSGCSTRFGIRDLVRLESDLASDQVPDLAPDLWCGTRFRTNSRQFGTECGTRWMPDLVANRIFDLGRDPERCHRSGSWSDLKQGLLPDVLSHLVRTLGRIEKEICCHVLHTIMYQNW